MVRHGGESTAVVFTMFKVKYDSFLLLLLYLCCAHALYFHIGETERKCFIEEIPDETMVIGNYKVQLYDPRTGGFMPSSPGIGMHVEVKDPEEKTILSRVYSSEGRFTFTSHTPGEHVICLYSNSTKWFSGTQLRVHLDIQVGEHAIDYANVAQKEKLTELQLRVRQLLDQVEQITKEQNYQRFREERYRQTCESVNKGVVWCIISHTLILLVMCSWTIKHLKSFSEAEELFREERFRQTSESTNQRVLWWSIAQTCILLVMGAWQMKHLKSFFEAKKLV